MEEALEITKDELENFLRQYPRPVLLGVFQPNCTPCGEVRQAVEQRKSEQVVFAEVNLQPEKPEDRRIADFLGVSSTPSVIAYCGGAELGRTSNPGDIPQLLSLLEQCASSNPNEEG